MPSIAPVVIQKQFMSKKSIIARTVIVKDMRKKNMKLKTKREIDIYIQSLEDFKESFNSKINIQIEYFKNYKKFVDK